MPACAECRMLVEGKCQAFARSQEILGRPLPPPPLSCMVLIAESYLPFITRKMRVLEIGCGSWDLIKSHCEAVGAHYEGIDVATEHFGKKTVATRIENLAELSFGDDQFDVVASNQSMEHWAEYGCSLKWGLHQCFRVCKPRGRVLLNVPIHFHGTRPFMLGELEKLQKLFALFSTRVDFYRWGYPSAPIPPLFPFPGYWPLARKPAFLLDIQAVKNRPLPPGCHQRFAPRGRLAQLLNYPVSYNLYRLLRKAGLFPQKALSEG